MPLRQKVFFLCIAVGLLLTIIDLVRRRRLRVEYSWLWIGAGGSIIVLILQYGLLVRLTAMIGAAIPTSTLFFLCILYLAVVCLTYAVRLSTLSWQVKELAQEVALLRQARAGGGDRAESGREPA